MFTALFNEENGGKGFDGPLGYWEIHDPYIIKANRKNGHSAKNDSWKPKSSHTFFPWLWSNRRTKKKCTEAVPVGPLNREEEAGNWHHCDDANQTSSSLLLS